MTDGNSLLSEDLIQQVQDIARDQNREPRELVSEAVRKYLEEQSWLRFVKNNERHAREMGIGEEDVDRLIAEVRRENAERGS
jgi:metal-responsive CopG/Arc/MetJ family transcriptional regulator